MNRRIFLVSLSFLAIVLLGATATGAGTTTATTLAPTLRVILVSAHRDRADAFRTAAEEVGAEAFVSKDDLDVSVMRAWSR